MFYGYRRDPLAGLFTDLAQMQREMSRLYDRVAGPSGLALLTAGPRINLWEDEANLYAETDLPGVGQDKVEVTVREGNELTIQSERSAPEVEAATWHRQERPWGQSVRTITLPVLVDPDRVEATLENGVLRLTLPKSEAAKPRKITVKA